MTVWWKVRKTAAVTRRKLKIVWYYQVIKRNINVTKFYIVYFCITLRRQFLFLIYFRQCYSWHCLVLPWLEFYFGRQHNVITHGSQTWSLMIVLERNIQSAQGEWRIVFGITWRDEKRTSWIREQTKVENISITIRIKISGHEQSMPCTEQILDGQPE